MSSAPLLHQGVSVPRRIPPASLCQDGCSLRGAKRFFQVLAKGVKKQSPLGLVQRTKQAQGWGSSMYAPRVLQ